MISHVVNALRWFNGWETVVAFSKSSLLVHVCIDLTLYWRGKCFVEDAAKDSDEKDTYTHDAHGFVYELLLHFVDQPVFNVSFHLIFQIFWN